MSNLPVEVFCQNRCGLPHKRFQNRPAISFQQCAARM